MIKEKELRDFRPDFQYKNGREITLDFVREKLEIAMQNASAPIAFVRDTFWHKIMIGHMI